MKKLIQYPKTGQFRNVIKIINDRVSYIGSDENGKAIYDPSIKKPVLTFKGTVKLHGTNAGVSYNNENGIWYQSKGNVITPNHDNYGFAFFAESNRELFEEFLLDFSKNNNINLDINTITVYGEWAGKSIQKKMGISLCEKSFFIFGVKISKPGDEDFKSFWIDCEDFETSPNNRIYNINDFQTFEIDIDMGMPKLVVNELTELTLKVEDECPVAKQLGHIGIGEGIVWSVRFKNDLIRFKVKGEKHSVSKVRTLAPVDIEKINSIKEFVDYSMTENRFEQAIQTIFGEDELDIKKMGDFIRWCINDIISEEIDTLSENNLEPKDVNKYVSAKAREMFFEKYNSEF